MLNDPNNSPPTAQDSYNLDTEVSESERDWLRLAQASFRSSVSYVDSNLRKSWDDSIRSFNNTHAADSKYNHPSYEKRSRLYRPKTRSIIRKNEAAGAAAFFSSMDVVSVTGTDNDNKQQVAGAAVNKALLQYRLSKSIPWFLTLLGGLQDAQTTGVVCGHVYWDYQSAKTPPRASERVPEPNNDEAEYPVQTKVPGNAFVADGEPKPATTPVEVAPQTSQAEPKALVDKPVVELVPCENLLIDPAANWTDPIESSPFVIHLMPVYLMDVRARMESGEWNAYGDGAIKASTATKFDSTRSARMNNREDPYNPDSKSFSGYEVCWVQRHIHRKDGEDWEFYTLGDFALLTEPRPLKETVFHGKRPYIMGCCILEAHKLYPTSVPQLGKDLQSEANEVANQRIDNVKFVLNKKWFVKRGKEADIGGLIRNVPGGVVMLDDPQNDVKEVTWPDVTASAYEEQSRIDNDMNDLLGNFSAGQVMADHGINGPARNMAMLGQSAGTLVEYLLRTYVETFVQPVLRQLMLLEQFYETDKTILAVASKSAELMQHFGTDEVTDELLSQELTLTVNVGMGATDPSLKLQKFLSAMNIYLEMLAKAGPGIDMNEVGKEIFSYMGYQDGSRFLGKDNPQLMQLQQKMQQMQQVIQNLELKVKDKSDSHLVKLKTADDANKTKMATTQIHEDNENLRNATTHLRAIAEAEKERSHAFRMKSVERAVGKVNHMRTPINMQQGSR
jgi:DNA-binding protein YbaB